jgi:branched-chain amino acid transport system permease protein
VSWLGNAALAGLFVGTFYGLVAVGYSMVYGVLRLINFAHGDFYMVAAFVSYALLTGLPVSARHSAASLAWVALVTMLAGGLLAVAAERLIYRPMRGGAMLSLMIAALGLSLVLQNGVLNIPAWGSEYRPYPYSTGSAGFSIGSTHYTWTQLVILGCAAVLCAFVYYLVTHTLLGKAMRAIAEDRTAAALMGVRVDRLIAAVFFIGGALAGAAAVMGGVYYGQINYLMGFEIGLQAFTAAIMGGIGNMAGAVAGGVALGVFQSIGTAAVGAQWSLVFSFSLLVLLLWLRPTGLLGERVAARM